MDEPPKPYGPPKSRFKGLAAPGIVSPYASRNPTARPRDDTPELPRTHVVHQDPPQTPRWKKIFLALFRSAPVIVAPVVDAYAVTQVQTAPQTHSYSAAQSLAIGAQTGETLQSANIDKLIPLLVIIVPEDNTEAKRTETKSILQEAGEFIRSLPGEVVGGAVKEAAKAVLVGIPMLAFAQFLKRRANETGNKCIRWCGEAVEKMAELFGKHAEKGVVTTEQLTAVFGDKTLAAETLLLQPGCKKQGNEWRRA